MFDPELSLATRAILDLSARLGLGDPGKVDWTPTPFAGQWAFGTPAPFQMAAAEARAGARINVPQRAQEIASQIAGELTPPAGFSHILAERGYINLYLAADVYAKRVLDEILSQAEAFGRGESKEERVMVEYAQPNTHHSFHIGHARNAILGESLARIVEFAGYDTIRASYPGDIGLGVMTCVWAYDKFYRGQEPEGVHERAQWLAKVYHEANSLVSEARDAGSEAAASQSDYAAEVRELYRRWDEGDPEARQLWLETRQWSLDELSAILEILGVEIDVYFYESEVDELAKQIVDELITKGIAEDERPDGPVFVEIDKKIGLEKETYRTAVILRSDGTTLYSTKDLALAKVKFERYQVDRSVYVVDVRQSLHFQQVFKILELWGFEQASNCYHLAYGFVTLPEGAMSSRLGNVILFMDLYEESIRRVQEIIGERNPSLPAAARDTVAHQVGLGALAYSMLAVDTTRDIIFEWDRALDFDGQAAPYIQYAHVRADSILRRTDENPPQPTAPEHDLATQEISLLDRLSRFPTEVQRAARDYRPQVIATYAYELAREFTDFYQHCPVLQAEGAQRTFRLALTAAARQTLANSLRLLTIDAPDVM